MRYSTRVDSIVLSSDIQEIQSNEWRALLTANDLYRIDFDGMIEKYEFKAYGIFLLQEKLLADYSGKTPVGL